MTGNNLGEIRRTIELRFKSKTRRDWEGVFDGKDARVIFLDESEGDGFEQRAAVGLTASPARAQVESG